MRLAILLPTFDHLLDDARNPILSENVFFSAQYVHDPILRGQNQAQVFVVGKIFWCHIIGNTYHAQQEG